MVTKFIDTLKPSLAVEDLLVGAEECAPYTYDLADGQTYRPAAVVSPRDAGQVAAILQCARRTGIGIIPRGAGTRPCLHAAVPGAVVMRLDRMDRIVRVDKGNRIAVVESGVSLARLREALAMEGLHFPPYPYAFETATVGGCAANGTGGPASLRHGVFKQNVLGMQVVTGDATIMEIGAYTMKNVVGYDLSTLLCGSEGTLGIITRLNLRLASLPAASRTLMAAFDTLIQAGEAVKALAELTNPPDRLALIDPWMRQWLAEHQPANAFPPQGAVVLCQTAGIDSVVRRNAADVAARLTSQGACSIASIQETPAAEALWRSRAAGLAALNRVDASLLTVDVSVPRTKATTLMQRIEEIARKHRLVIANTGHSGCGVFQPVILSESTDPRRMDAVVAELKATVLSLGGHISRAYPRLGVERAKFKPLQATGLDRVFKGLKAVFDPGGTLKPGHSF